MKVGDVVGNRFLLEAVAGIGGMGEVFRAHDRRTGSPVAVKVLRQAGGHGPRFEREVRLLAELHHPSIVRHVEHGTTRGGEPYLAMEWLDGHDLAEHLAQQRLTVAACVSIAAQTAAALSAAHQLGAIHRDIKPRNIFLVARDPDQVRVLDFGVAHLSDDMNLTSVGAIVGTPAFMAPEQARGARDLTPSVDIFALGAVLFECLTGEPAFPGVGALSVLARILFEEAPRVSQFRGDVPPAVDRLVARMLDKDPQRRPRDGAQVVAALQQIARGTGAGSDDPAGDVAGDSVSSSTSSLTGRERRMASILIVGPPTTAVSPAEGSVRRAATERRLLGAVEEHGGRLETLADDSWIVSFAGVGATTDEVARAALCALALKSESSDRPMALVTGQTEVGHRIPNGDALDDAAANVSRGGRRSDEPGTPGIMVDATTHRLLAERFQVQQTGTGRYLVGTRAGGTVPDAPLLLGRPSPFVGRGWELGAIREVFARATADSQPQAVLVTGSPGFGKSRLGYEAVQVARKLRPDVEVWVGRADSLQAGSTFALLGQALRGALGIVDGEPLPARRAALESAVALVVAPAIRHSVVEFLGELAGVRAPDDTASPSLRAARQDPLSMGDHMKDAWINFLSARVAHRPVLLVLEDLHWGDLSTVRFVDAALRELTEAPFMVLALARPEVHDLFPRLWSERAVLEIRLRELSRTASEQLVREVLGDLLSPDKRQRLVEQAEGHAFYLEELIRAAGDGASGELPGTVLAMVQARLDHLEPAARRVLRAASVFGETFWDTGVAALLGREPLEETTHGWLRTLVDREIVARRPESRFPSTRELRFRHALLRDGAYAMLTDDDRRIGHELAGNWLADAGEIDPMVLAEHFERGVSRARAAPWFLRAAEDANRGGDPDATMARAQRGLACGATGTERSALGALLCEAHGWRMQLEPCLEHADRVLAEAPAGSAPWSRAATAKLGCALHLGRADMFDETFQRVRVAEPAPGAIAASAFALTNAGFVLTSAGRPAQARMAEERLDEMVAPEGDREPLAQAWRLVIKSFLSLARDEDGLEGVKRTVEGRALFQSIGHQVGMAISDVLQAWCRCAIGGYAEAERLILSSLASGRDIGLISSLRPGIHADALIGIGRIDEAIEVASEAIADGKKRGLEVHEGRGHWGLARGYLACLKLKEAEEELGKAAGQLAVVPPDWSAVSGTLAAVLLASGRPREALAAATRALEGLTTQGTPGFGAAAARLIVAEAQHALDDNAGAVATITDAWARLEARGARIADRSVRATFFEAVPAHARTRALARAWLAPAPRAPASQE